MSATDELRAELTKRGVKWKAPASFDGTARYDTTAGGYWFHEFDGKITIHGLTPAQAIAATLGRGECHDEGTFRSWGYFTCSNCKVVVPVEAVREAPSIGKVVPISFCPNCGKRVEVSE